MMKISKLRAATLSSVLLIAHGFSQPISVKNKLPEPDQSTLSVKDFIEKTQALIKNSFKDKKNLVSVSFGELPPQAFPTHKSGKVVFILCRQGQGYSLRGYASTYNFDVDDIRDAWIKAGAPSDSREAADVVQALARHEHLLKLENPKAVIPKFDRHYDFSDGLVPTDTIRVLKFDDSPYLRSLVNNYQYMGKSKSIQLRLKP